MKRAFIALCLALFSSLVSQAQDLTAEDRRKAIEFLDHTRNEVLEATKGLSTAQWNYKPAPDRWSVAQVAEHIAAAEDFLMDMVRDKVMKAPPRTAPADVQAVDAFVMQAVPDRSKKVQAPEPLRPTNRFGTPKESLKHFKQSRAKTIQFVKTTPALRQHAVDSPLGKQLDAYEWVLFVAAHSERHKKQIDEVKADPNFPKK